MQIPCKLIKSIRMLASRLFKHQRPANGRAAGHAAGRAASRGAIVTEFHPTIDGTLLVVRSGDHSLVHLVTTVRYTRRFACSGVWLKECQVALGYVDVKLEPDAVNFHWQADAIPQSLRMPEVECQPLPTTPPMSPVDTRLIQAMAGAMATVDRQSTRYALSCIQLDAETGTVNGTDGRRMVRYDGFVFPWRDRAILLPENDVFGSPQLRDATRVSCGLCEDRLVIDVTSKTSGTWTLRLPIQTEGRFPNVAMITQSLREATNRVYFDQRDLAFVVKHLKRFPGEDRDHCPVSLDLNGHVDLAACGDERTRSLRLRLSRTFQVGKPITLSMNRHYLRHAAQCGITNLLGYGTAKPVVCRGPNLTYVWQPLTGIALPDDSPETIQIDTNNYETQTSQ